MFLADASGVWIANFRPQDQRHLAARHWVLFRGSGNPVTSYTSITIRIVKVLDFVQFGGPKLTVGRTTFEMVIPLHPLGNTAFP